MLTDGTVIKRKISECYISIPQGEGHTPVVLGEADDHAPTWRRHARNTRSSLQPLQANPTTNEDDASLIPETVSGLQHSEGLAESSLLIEKYSSALSYFLKLQDFSDTPLSLTQARISL